VASLRLHGKGRAAHARAEATVRQATGACLSGAVAPESSPTQLPAPQLVHPAQGTLPCLPGTKAAFESVIDSLKTCLGAEDLLLVHTNNHGGHDGNDSYICTYAGEPLAIDGHTLRRERELIVLFVDLEPMLNWGHRCRYLLLREVPPTLSVVWRGPSVPEWAVEIR